MSSQPGIYCPQELIDFGLVPSNSEPKTLKLFILNSGTKAIPVQNVIATPVSEAVSIDFHPPSYFLQIFIDFHSIAIPTGKPIANPIADPVADSHPVISLAFLLPASLFHTFIYS